MFGDYEKAIARKTASIFGYAANKGYSPISFTKSWFDSRTAFNLYNYDFRTIGQGYKCIFCQYEEEKNIKQAEKALDLRYKDIMYWCGYIFSSWMYIRDIHWNILVDKYEIENIIASYDTLHTLSVKTAIEYCEENYNRTKNIIAKLR